MNEPKPTTKMSYQTDLIVNYLPQNLTDEELRSMFLSIGPLNSCRIIRDHATNYSYGFGFVDFKQAKDAAKAIDTLNGLQLQNKRIKVAYSRKGEDVKGTNLYIRGLPPEYTESDLRQLFKEYGKIVNCRVLLDSNTKQGKGVGFVLFSTRPEALQAIKGANDKELEGGRTLNVQFAEEYTLKARPGYSGYVPPQQQPQQNHQHFYSSHHYHHPPTTPPHNSSHMGGAYGAPQQHYYNAPPPQQHHQTPPGMRYNYRGGGGGRGGRSSSMSPHQFQQQQHYQGGHCHPQSYGGSGGGGAQSFNRGQRPSSGGSQYYNGFNTPAGAGANGGHNSNYSSGYGGGGAGALGNNANVGDNEYVIFVYNIGPHSDELSLVDIFSPFGNIAKTSVIRDQSTGQGKGYGFVTMTNYRQALAAVNELHGFRYMGRPLQVSFKHK